MKKLLSIALGVLLAVSLVGCQSNGEPAANTGDGESTKLLIAAAASLTDVTAKIKELYKDVAPDVELEFTYGSSGALQSQIEEGAPVDIFMSAAMKQMTELTEKDFIQEDTKVDLLENKVVLIVPADSELGLTGFEDLGEDKVKTVALGEPESVPVGQYSETIFENMGILDTVKAKANYGTDVRQVLTWVESGEIDCGIVYATDAAISDKVTVISEAPEGTSDPVIYPVAVLKESKSQDAAKAFADFLGTDEILALFEQYGFSRVK